MKKSPGKYNGSPVLQPVLLICLVSLIVFGCSRPKKDLVFESKMAVRYPGSPLKPGAKTYSDSTFIILGQEKITLQIEWNTFTDAKFQCLKVGDIRILKNSEPECTASGFELTPLPCAMEWFTDDTTISEKVLVSASFEIQKKGRKHSFDGSFCSIDGKGRLVNLVK